MMKLENIEVERSKYQRMWAQPRYRTHSPGESIVNHFLNHMPWTAGDTLIDLGCGTGRAGVELAKRGLLVFLFDLVPSALDKHVKLPFIEGCLWHLPQFAFDWIYCTDVLEHIPPDCVDASLDGMAAITRKGGLLQIAHFHDGCGRLIGETLHLTVESPEWWKEKIQKRWPILGWESDGARTIARVGYGRKDNQI